jgi:hypothetical protein
MLTVSYAQEFGCDVALAALLVNVSNAVSFGLLCAVVQVSATAPHALAPAAAAGAALAAAVGLAGAAAARRGDARDAAAGVTRASAHGGTRSGGAPARPVPRLPPRLLRRSAGALATPPLRALRALRARTTPRACTALRPAQQPAHASARRAPQRILAATPLAARC